MTREYRKKKILALIEADVCFSGAYCSPGCYQEFANIETDYEYRCGVFGVVLKETAKGVKRCKQCIDGYKALKARELTDGRV